MATTQAYSNGRVSALKAGGEAMFLKFQSEYTIDSINSLLIGSCLFLYAPGASAQEAEAPRSNETSQETQEAEPTTSVSTKELAEIRSDMQELRKQLKLNQELQEVRAELKEARRLLRQKTETEQANQKEDTARAKGDVDAAPEEAPAKILAQGQFYLGGTFGASYNGKDNVGTLFGTVDDGNTFKADVSGVFGRILVEDSIGVGVVVRYTTQSRKSTFDDTSSSPGSNTESAEYHLTAGPAFRGYVPLIENRLFVTYQGSLTVGYTERVDRTFQTDTSSVVDANGYSFNLNVQPGIMVAATDSFAIEMGINLLGLDYTHYKTTTDYTDVGKENAATFNVDVNLLSLQFAFVGYF